MDRREPMVAIAEAIGERVLARSQTVAAAESLTGGMLTNALAIARGASHWLRGGLVAYSTDVKRSLLRVRAESVVSQAAAEEMARGVAALLQADLAIAVTGVAGPRPQNGVRPGTVCIGVSYLGQIRSERIAFPGGDPGLVCEQAANEALRMALEIVRSRPRPLEPVDQPVLG